MANIYTVAIFALKSLQFLAGMSVNIVLHYGIGEIMWELPVIECVSMQLSEEKWKINMFKLCILIDAGEATWWRIGLPTIDRSQLSIATVINALQQVPRYRKIYFNQLNKNSVHPPPHPNYYLSTPRAGRACSNKTIVFKACCNWLPSIFEKQLLHA